MCHGTPKFWKDSNGTPKFYDLKLDISYIFSSFVLFVSQYSTTVTGYSELLSEISIVLKLILVLPASDAESERVFSALKRIKTYLRNSMSQARLNHIMLLNIHKEEAEKMSLAGVVNEFAAKNDRRRADFGYNKFE